MSGIPLEEIDRRIAELEAKKKKRDVSSRQSGGGESKKKKKSEKQDRKLEDMSDVDVCTHLSVWKLLYHTMWSGELEKLRNGLLTDSQAIAIVVVTLLLPLLGGGSTMLVMFSMIKQLTSGGWRTDALVVVGCNLVRWPLVQMTSSDTPLWEQIGGDVDIANFLLFLLQAGTFLAWAHVSLSSGGDRWQGEHGLKFAALLGLFAIVHNPASTSLWKPFLLGLISGKAK